MNEMNEAWIWQYMGGGGGGSPDVDVILGRVVTYWWWLITKGVRGVKNLGKSDYVIRESP